MRGFPFAQNGLKVYGECQLVAEATIKGKPDLIARYMRATQKSLRWALANPEETAHLLCVAYPELKEASVLVNHKTFMTYVFNEISEKVGLGGFDREQVQRTFDWLELAGERSLFLERAAARARIVLAIAKESTGRT